MKSLLVVLCALFLTAYLRSQPILVTNGDVVKIEQNGTYLDRKIPHESSLNGNNYINFNLKGADGGAYKSDLNVKKGGGGAIVRASFKIGTGPGELRPEGIIRFVVGKRGESVRKSVVAGGGGGGGTAILYKHPDVSVTCSQVSTNLADAGSCWVLLAVAGGGGGAYLEGRGKGGNDGECGKNGGDGDGGDGGCNGNGGDRGTDGSSTAAGGGGGAFSEGGGGPQGGNSSGRFGGGKGNFTGGDAGVSGSKSDGGFGYGGGGGGGQALAIAGGGGGGGYSGGGGGYFSEGGGGGSFANTVAQFVDKEEGGSDGSPDPGHVIYQLVTREGPTARCDDITVSLSNGTATITGQSLDDGSTAESGETVNGFLLGVEISPDNFFIRFDYTYDCADIGEHTVKLIIQSSSGQIDECLSRVEVIDEVAPVVSCTSSVLEVVLDTDGQYEFSTAELNAAGTAGDACGAVVDRYLGAGLSCSQTGIQTVPLIVEDNSGNIGSCQLTVNVSDVNVVDETPPVLACEDVTVVLDANGTATITAAEVGAPSYDNCAIQSYTAFTIVRSGSVDELHFFPLSFDNCSPLTSFTAYLSQVTDQSGNETTGSCAATITLQPYSGISRWYVNGGVSKSGGGTSWSCAFKTLQEALHYADDGDEIWMAAGTYYPDEGLGQTNDDRLASFGISAGLSIYGGFAGGESSLAERDWHTNVTVLSGDLMQNDGENFSNYSDNAYHVLSTTGNFSTPVLLNGLVIRGGNAEGRLIISEGGGTALNNYRGGGFRVASGGAYIFEHCTFADCYAQQGGALALDGAYVPISLIDCTFENNKALELAGAVGISAPNTSIVNCIFLGNEAGQAGAALFDFSLKTDVVNCIFSGNEAPNGVIYTEGPDLSLINCSLSGNAGSTFQSSFGAISSLDNCILWGNESAITNCGSCTTTVNNSIIQGGYAGNQNLDIDPLFINGLPIGVGVEGDLRLQACSPALDAGNDSANTLAEDLAGNNRKFDAISGGPLIDLGAYEYQNTLTASCRDQTVSLDQNGTASLDVALLDGGSSGCMPLSLEVEGETVLNFSCDDVTLSPFYYTLTVSDGNGAERTCNATVQVVNNSGPVAICQNATVSLGGNGEATLTPEAINNGSYGICNSTDLVYELNQTIFSCLDVGTKEVVLSITDNAGEGNTSTCTAIVEVVDPRVPIIQCISEFEVFLDENGQATLLPDELITSASDNCTPSDELQRNVVYEGENGEFQWAPSLDLHCEDLGTQLIGAIVFDAAGNYSLPCEVVITITDPNGYCSGCEPTLTLSGSVSDGIYRAAETIESDGLISSGASVTFLAGSSIRLTPGFHAAADSDFLARIEDCEAVAAARSESPSVPEAVRSFGATTNFQFTVFPNPFTQQFVLQYDLEEATEIEVHLISMGGKARQQLLSPQLQPSGTHRLEWDGGDLAAGIYVVQLRLGETWYNRKVVKIK